MATMNFSQNIWISVNNLCEKNNGFFKSEKQSKFLCKVLEEQRGRIDNGQYASSVFVEWDNEGITKKYKVTYPKGKEKITILFERKIQGCLTTFEKKRIKQLKRSLKSGYKDIIAMRKLRVEGKYDNDEQYFRCLKQNIDSLRECKKLIKELLDQNG